ncbi:MAG: hypothetical protein GY729_21205 [Desulfobacteraceae bacterium]|nr:hypothetical protein [Desulfobacteraceae bacterium]
MKSKEIICVLFVAALCFTIAFGCGKKEEVNIAAIDLVEQDLEQGKIDKNTALVYKMYALFNHPDLPQKYHSRVMTRKGDALLRKIRKDWDSLSDEAQKKLAPFFLNPLDPKSALYLGNDKEETLARSFGFTKKAYANIPSIAGLNHYVTDNGKVKIWYKSYQQQAAITVRDAFNNDKIHEKETALMGRVPLPDDIDIGDDVKLDIFFKNISDHGLCYPGPVSNRKCYGWIVLKQSMTGNRMKTTAAHEYFHAIQYAIDFTEKDWWQESTATWAEHLIYPDADLEHEWLPEYFKENKMAKSLTIKDEKHEYGAYVFPLYIAQKYGNNKVGQIWQACESALANAQRTIELELPGGWKDTMKEFSLWSYNQEPARHFRDRPGKFLPATPEIDDVWMSTEETLEEEVAPLAVRIINYWVDQPTIRSVDFDLDRFHSIYPDIALWAVIETKNGDERVEDWTDLSFKNFCFDLPEEDLKRVALIYGNGSQTRKKEKLFDIDYFTHEYGCSAKLELSWNVTQQGGGEAVFGKYVKGFATGKGSYDENGNLSVMFRQEIVDPDDPNDPESGKQLVPYGSFTFSAGYQSGGRAGVKSVYSMGGHSSGRGSGSDQWKGSRRSKNKKGLLRLHIIKHKKNQEQPELTAEELNAVPESMRNMLTQLQSLQESLSNNMPPGIEMPKEPGEGEIKYKLFLRIENIPGRFSGTADIQSSAGGGSTTFAEDIEVGMIAPIEFEGIVPENIGVIPLNKSFSEGSIQGRVSGVLKLGGN